MYKQYRQMVDDSTPGRFEGEGPMTAYVYDLYANGDFGDDRVTIEHLSAGWNRYGRRILVFGESGFISLATLDTVEEAKYHMAQLHDEYDDDDEDVD